jgi:type III secretion protein F
MVNISKSVDPEFIIDMSHKFNKGATDLNKKLKDALDKIRGEGPDGNPSNTSDPIALAEYQAALSFCNAQSSTIKAYKDIASATISNFR